MKTRGLREKEMVKVAQYIDDAFTSLGDKSKLNSIGKEVNNMMKDYPLFQ